MALKELKCPNCGADLTIEPGVNIIKCKCCNSVLEYDDGSIRIHKTVHIVDEAGIAAQQVKLERIAAKERADIREKKEMKYIAIGIICMIAIGILIAVLSPSTKTIPAPAEHTGNFRGQEYKQVQSILESAGFTNVECIEDPVLDMTEPEKFETVTKVTIDGETHWNSKKYPVDSKVYVSFATFNPNGKVRAPKTSSDDYSNMKYEDVLVDFQNSGYTNIICMPMNDLVNGQEQYDGLVNKVTINGDSYWYTFLTGTYIYHRKDPVKIYYHSMSETTDN